MKSLTCLMKNQAGASAAEYAVILAIIGTAIVAASIFLGNAVGASLSKTGACISSDGANC